MGILVLRSSQSVGGGDPTEQVGSYAAMDLEAYPVYRIDSSAEDMPFFCVEGGTHTLETNTSWDGGYAHKITPLIAGTAPATGQGRSALGSFNIDKGGTFGVQKLYTRFEMQMGSALSVNLVQMVKLIIVNTAETLGGASSEERPMYYLANMGTEAGDAPAEFQVDGLMAFGVACTTVKNFEPLETYAGYNWPRGNEDFLWGSSDTTISGKPIRDQTSWFTFELLMISVATAEWPNGVIRGRITDRSGNVLTDLWCPWNWDASWTLGNYIIELETLGGYWNATETPGANNYIRISDGVTFAAGVDDMLGTRAGFVT